MELKIDLSETHVFVWPRSPDEVNGPPPEDDAILFCFISLSIPPNVTPNQLSSLSLSLRATENIGFQRAGYETNHPFEVSLDCESATELDVQSGKVYRWELPIQIPHSSTPYERCSSGRAFYRLSAKAQFAGNFLTRKTLTADRDIFVIPIPSKEAVLEYARSHGSFAEHLGPIAIVMRSQHLTVGGYARFAMSLPSPSPSLVVKQVALTLIETATLHSRKNPGYVERRQDRITFHSVDAAEMLNLQQADGTFDCDWVARLPHDSRIRPSTLPGSNAAIRLSHIFEAQVIFAADFTPDSPDLHYKASWPIVLPNCGCQWRSLRLPEYSILDADPVPVRSRDDWQPDKYANIHVSHGSCACGETLEQMLSWEKEADDTQAISTTQAMREQMQSEWARPRADAVNDASTEQGEASSSVHSGLPVLPAETEKQRLARLRRLKAAQEYVAVGDYEGTAEDETPPS